MDSSPQRNVLFSSNQVLPELEEAVAYIGTTTSVTECHHEKLLWLSRKLNSIKFEVLRELDGSIDESQMVPFMERLSNSKQFYYDLVSIVNKTEGSLANLLDLIESKLVSPDLVNGFNELLDLTEDCTSLATELKVRLNSKMPLLEASLEYNEISKDHIDTLELVVDTNISRCFEVQEKRFTSPVRHPQAFTLKQVVRLLASHVDTAEPTIPTFSSMEESICRKYLDIQRTLSPISKSLTEILPARIDHFSKRTIIHIDHLTDLLRKKYRGVLDKHKIMVKEVGELKRDLVDKRWNSLFLNLNQELRSILDDIEHLESIIRDYKNNLEVPDKVKEQLRRKSNTVTKTFNVIYRALEFSLLDVDVASTTNELAQRWLDIRPESDRLLLSSSSSSTDETNLDGLSSRLRSFSLGSSIDSTETEPSPIQPSSGRGKFGALLLKKMNIKPVMITSPSKEDDNPFFDNSSFPKDEGSRLPDAPVEPVPRPLFKSPGSLLERPETPLDTSEPISNNAQEPSPERPRSPLETFEPILNKLPEASPIKSQTSLDASDPILTKPPEQIPERPQTPLATSEPLLTKPPESISEKPQTPSDVHGPILHRAMKSLGDESINSIISSIKNNHISAEDLEEEKINYYAQTPSHIPKLKDHVSLKFNLPRRRDSNSLWTPGKFTYSNNGGGVNTHLPRPTPLTDILMTRNFC